MPLDEAGGSTRHGLVGLQRGDARHGAKHVATRPHPARPYNDALRRNRRRISSCLNLRLRRLEDTANDLNSPKINRRKGQLANI